MQRPTTDAGPVADAPAGDGVGSGSGVGEAPVGDTVGEPVSGPASGPVVDAPTQTSPPAGPVGTRRVPARANEGVVEAPVGTEPTTTGGPPRYHRAPFAESMWPAVVGKNVLLIFGSGARECVRLVRKTPSAVHYVHRKNGNQQVPMTAVTSIHENSWECEYRDGTPAEWARSGVIVGLGLATLGAGLGVAYDIGYNPKAMDQAKIPHYAYTVVGIPLTTFATPIVAIGGASTTRDLRVRGKLWARAVGWTLYSAATVLNVLWLTGFYSQRDDGTGGVEALRIRGLTATAGLLGVAGAGFMAFDALSSRSELARLRQEDSTRRPSTQRGLHLGLAPLRSPVGQVGMSLGVSGRF